MKNPLRFVKYAQLEDWFFLSAMILAVVGFVIVFVVILGSVNKP